MNQHEYDDQTLSDRHPFTVQQFSEEFSAILAKQIVQKGTDSEILSLLKRFVPDVNWPVRIGKNNSCFSALLASFINCGLTTVTTNELEYGEYTTVPPLKEGISY
jgi:hypothetical protein